MGTSHALVVSDSLVSNWSETPQARKASERSILTLRPVNTCIGSTYFSITLWVIGILVAWGPIGGFVRKRLLIEARLRFLALVRLLREKSTRREGRS